MTNSNEHKSDILARAVVRHLDRGTETLPHDVSERLKAARHLALQKRREVLIKVTSTAVHSNGSSTLSLGGWVPKILRPIGFTTALGLFLVSWMALDWWQSDAYLQDLADVDVQILTGDLPTNAYTDPGFAQYLRVSKDD